MERVDLYPDAVSQANAIAIDGTSLYIAGYYLDGMIRAAVWTNDASSLEQLNTQVSDAKAVTRFNGETFTAGDYLDATFVRRATYWRGTAQIDLAIEVPTEPAFANGIAVVDGEVYVAGVRGAGDTARAVYWNNGNIVALSTLVESQASSLFVR